VLPKGYEVGEVHSKAIDYYALSWGVPRKPAWNLVETAQRKSQRSGDARKAILQHILDLTTFNKDAGAAGVIFAPDICKSTTYPLSSGDFYLMQFSDNQNLTFHDQAKELEAIINAVSAANGLAKVILVAHSMGGLAARSYLQFISPTADKVLKLITVGTPHQGADINHLCESTPICTAFGIHLGSIAVAELDPTASSALKDLNDLIRHPLPTRVSYTSITGIGTFVIGDGDGIVSASSQNLRNVIGMNIGVHFHHTAKSINVAKCYLTEAWPEVHTCETSDTKVLTEVLYQIYECDTLNSNDSVTTGFAVPWNVFDPIQLILKAFCTNSSVTADIGPATYVYNQGYAFANNQWYQITYTCTGGQIVQNAWCPNSMSATLPNSSTYYVAYTCNWSGTKWMCGCRDQTCAQNLWQLQKIR
jgi:PGAP1-like protein